MSTPASLKSVLKLSECNVTLLSSYCVYTYIAFFRFCMCVFVYICSNRQRQWWINAKHPTSPLAIPDLFSFNLFHWSHGNFFLTKSESLILSNNFFVLFHSPLPYSFLVLSHIQWLLQSFCSFPLLLSEEVTQWQKSPFYSPSEWRELVQHTVAAVNWKHLEEM